MTDSHASGAVEQATLEQRQREGVTRWIEANIGGRVSAIERLRRWRPVWRVDYERDGVSRPIFVKSLRPWESIPYSLRHEMRVMQVLEANGVAVPHVYGMMEFPEAFVMDWVEGDTLFDWCRARCFAGDRPALAALPASTDPTTMAFWKKFRSLTIGAYYTTEAGFKDIGYIGNVARTVDPGPSAEVKAVLEAQLKKLGL